MLVFRTHSHDEFAEIPELLAWRITRAEFDSLRKAALVLKQNHDFSEVHVHASYESLAEETDALTGLFEAAANQVALNVPSSVLRSARARERRSALGDTLDLRVDCTAACVLGDNVWLECNVKNCDILIRTDTLTLDELGKLAGFTAKQAA